MNVSLFVFLSLILHVCVVLMNKTSTSTVVLHDPCDINQASSEHNTAPRSVKAMNSSWWQRKPIKSIAYNQGFLPENYVAECWESLQRHKIMVPARWYIVTLINSLFTEP